ncbi:VC0807 family protein [Paenibacillus sp. UNC451MF]|uniref:VC0807 family protein n=1 Tax=Paenibacillus sp. UNC451MF TaxID=1449063 RepID=UPI00048A63B2|nr:VC0807 family protein [Paenibacillus sp. UNC451MF]
MSRVFRGIIITLLINGAVPYVLYVWLSEYMSSFAALSIATVVPMADNLIHLAKYKKLDVFGGMMLFTFLMGIGLILLGGDEKLLLIRESFITAAVGLLFLVSLLFRRPLIYHLAMRFTVKDNTNEKSSFAANWDYSYFRFVVRLMTAVWGGMLLAEAGVRIVLVFELTTAQFLAVSNLVFYGFIGVTILWTALYRKRSKARMLEIKSSKSVL